MVNRGYPVTKKEALTLLAAGGKPIVAGGTDLMVKLRVASGVTPAILPTAVFISHLDELKYIKQGAGLVKIGALTPLEDILGCPMVPAVLCKAIAETAAPGIRHSATLAGNLANASPAADPTLALVALGAKLKIESLTKKRTVAAGALALAPGSTVLEQDEMIVEIQIPDVAWSAWTFDKIGGRKADAIAKVSFCGAVRFDNGRIADLRIAFGAVAKTIIRMEAAEAAFHGFTAAELKENRSRLWAAYEPFIRPIDDQRSDKQYRRKVAFHLFERFITGL